MSTSDNSSDKPPQPGPIRQRVRSRPRPSAIAEPVDPEPGEAPTMPIEPAAAGPVGYGNPPVHTRWKKGQSGNPKGRPKGAQSLNSIILKTMTPRVASRIGGREVSIPPIELLFLKAAEVAAKGNGRIMALMFQLYAAAAAEQIDQAKGSQAERAANEPTATDLAILEELRQEMMAGFGINLEEPK